MNRILTLSTLALLLISFEASAKPAYLKKFKAQYPSSKLKECMTCHNEDYSRNSYGEDLQKTKVNFKAVEQLDSDGDGAINLAEINAGTFPGDKSSVPLVEGAQ